MKKDRWTKRALSLLLLICLMAGCAAAESWPSDSATTGDGRTIKTVPAGEGKVEVWEFIGIFGEKEDALKAVGLTEEDGEKPEEKGGVTEIAGKKVTAKKTKKAVPLKWKVSQPKKETEEKEKPGVTEENGKKKLKRSSRKRARKMQEILDKTVVVDRLIYIQDNRGSGR